MLGFAYFLTATALITIFQENLADTERASVMPLWFMAFGGSVPIGNLVFGPVIDAIGARWVLGLGAVVAVVAGPVVRPAAGLAPSGDLSLERRRTAPGCTPATPARATRDGLDEHDRRRGRSGPTRRRVGRSTGSTP